ncbi:MAG: hypothetical protein K9M99_00280 [Candidatus Cloacimonetes bacterium]|nr:hypothetical protein [Candidatus Cloacimonadota bacterium]
MLKFVFFTVLLCIFALNAQIGDIPVTRNLLEDQYPVKSYHDFSADQEFDDTAYQEKVHSSRSERGTWLAIVDSGLYVSLEIELAVWTQDLEREERNVIILSWTGTSYIDLKTVISDYYDSDNILGVFLLGNLPVFWFELWEDWDADGVQGESEYWVEFPMDQYFADLDGIWSDLDNDGVYDLHDGDMAAELAISRLRADNLSYAGEEVQILSNWFERNHLYRNGVLTDSDIALGYIDDDWSYWADEYENALLMNYSEVEMVSEINNTTAYDYRENRWNGTYEWIQVHVHSGPDAHYFYQNNGSMYQLVHNNEILPCNPNAMFYNLFCCSNARFTQDNSMGSLYVLGNEHGMASIGSTKTGSMLDFENFYGPLGDGEVMGEALRMWWNDTMVEYESGEYQQCYRSWFYGMALTGDPTLLTEYEPVSEKGDVDYNSEIEAYDASMILRYCVGIYPGITAPLPWGAARTFFADVDNDQQVSSYDAALILQYFVGIINQFPQDGE